MSPSKVPALADAAALAAELPRLRAVPRRRVLRSGRRPGRRGPGRRRGHGRRSSTWCRPPMDTARPTSDGRRAESTDLIADIARIAHENDATIEVIIATAWDCPFDGPTDPQRVVDIATAAVEIGADRIAIADTIGTTTPRRVTALIERLRPVLGDLPLGAHFHNTRGAGLASAYAAVDRGRHEVGLVGRRARRLPVRPRRQRQHRHRGSGVHVARQRHRRRRRPAGGDPRGGRRTQGRRPRPAERSAARRRSHPGLSPAMPAETLTAKGRQTREAIELAARKLFAERGFHGTTLSRDHVRGGQVARGVLPVLRRQGGPAGGRWPSRSCATWSRHWARSCTCRNRPRTREFFVSAVTGYWNMFKQNIGIMVAVDQLASAQPRFADLQNEFRRFGIDIVRASVLRAQEQGYGADLDPEHTALAISLLFERFTTVYLRADAAMLGVTTTDAERGAHAVDDLEEDAVRLLSTAITRKESEWISPCPSIFRACWPRWTPSSRRRSSRWKPRTCSTSTSDASTPARTGRTTAFRSGPGRTCSTRCAAGPTRRAGCATACRRGSADATAPTSTWPSSGNTWRTRDSDCTTTCRTSRRSSAIFRRSS